jgi:N-acetyl-D-muramate 6-phosphate phosphatase
MTTAPQRVRAVLFDLDGTLIDTAPDMIGALNALREQESLAPLAYALARTQVSHGSTGLLRLAFPGVDTVRCEELRARFLNLYAARLARESALFDGCAEVLDALEAHGIVWGVVTNKPGWLTEPLLRALRLEGRAGCVVSGDSLPERKPHPLPLLHAAHCLQIPPAQCVYIGDAQRDILAARAAGMPVLVASYGYLGPEDDAPGWAADGDLQAPLALLSWLGIAATRRVAG